MSLVYDGCGWWFTSGLILSGGTDDAGCCWGVWSVVWGLVTES